MCKQWTSDYKKIAVLFENSQHFYLIFSCMSFVSFSNRKVWKALNDFNRKCSQTAFSAAGGKMLCEKLFLCVWRVFLKNQLMCSLHTLLITRKILMQNCHKFPGKNTKDSIFQFKENPQTNWNTYKCHF